MSGRKKKIGRPRRGEVEVVNVAISKAVMERFRKCLGPDRILCRAVELALDRACKESLL